MHRKDYAWLRLTKGRKARFAALRVAVSHLSRGSRSRNDGFLLQMCFERTNEARRRLHSVLHRALNRREFTFKP